MQKKERDPLQKTLQFFMPSTVEKLVLQSEEWNTYRAHLRGWTNTFYDNKKTKA